MKVFLDDIRQPYDSSWSVARNLDEFKNLILSNDVTEISFDHDLGEENGAEVPSGLDAANWLVWHALDYPDDLKHLQKVQVHSSNPPGADNIFGLIKNASKHDVLPVNLEVVKRPYESRI